MEDSMTEEVDLKDTVSVEPLQKQTEEKHRGW